MTVHVLRRPTQITPSPCVKSCEIARILHAINPALFPKPEEVHEKQSRPRGSRQGVVQLLAQKKQMEPVIDQGGSSKNSAFEWVDSEQPPIYSNLFDRLTGSEAQTDATATEAGLLERYLDYTEDDIRALAIELANETTLRPVEKIARSARLLDSIIPGDTPESQYARTCCAKFWRRALRVRIARAREHVFLRLFLIGRYKEQYASDLSVDQRETQLRRQRAWMQNTIVVPQSDSSTLLKGAKKHRGFCLANLAKGPEHHFAKLYTFIYAIDQLGIAAKLMSAMITLTLEPEWHPNPSHGGSSWNGASPKAAHNSFSKRWQSVLRDLHREEIRPSGFRVAEPHKDGCPHYHVWMLYRAEHETTILSTIMRYFPNKLKIRAPAKKGEDNSHLDKVFENRSFLINGVSRSLTHKKEGAQVEVSRIDRSIGSGASYAIKYVMKSINVSEDLHWQIGGTLNEKDQAAKKQKGHENNVRRVDAYRCIWGIHQGRLFGVAKCLTVWDEFRRLASPPKNRLLRKLWAQARGSSKPGRIEAGTGTRGDAQAFLTSLGGLDAARIGRTKRLMLGRLVEANINQYGDRITKTKGIRLLKKERKQVWFEKINPMTKQLKTFLVWRSTTTVIASIQTRLIAWIFQKKPERKRARQRREFDVAAP